MIFMADSMGTDVNSAFFLKAPSSIYDHQNITGHDTTIDNFSIVGREDQKPNQSYQKSYLHQGE